VVHVVDSVGDTVTVDQDLTIWAKIPDCSVRGEVCARAFAAAKEKTM
jgi:hypothetical protein